MRVTGVHVHTIGARLARLGLASAFAAAWSASSIATAQPLNLETAETFAVLARSTVTNSGATTVGGDVGVGEGGAITGTPLTLVAGSVLHEGDAVAEHALMDALATDAALAAMACGTNLSGQNLGGQSLAPGVYCFDGDALLTGGPLTLTGTGPWTFQIAGDLTTDSSVAVPVSTRTCDGSSVFWRVGDQAAIGAGTAFVGNLLAQNGVTLGSGAAVDGRALALAAASTVSLLGNTVNACSFGELLPAHAPFKVTGGGQINVPDPSSAGFANYGFNARPEAAGGASGHLNYLNHVTGLHVNGTVTDVAVVTLQADGSPEMVRISGTCTDGPACTFSATVADQGEPATSDRFGIVVTGSAADEATADRVVKNGNIQFHLSLTTTLNGRRFRAGDVMAVSASMTPGAGAPLVDAYLVLRLPDGQLLSWTPGGLVPGLVPLARNVQPVSVRQIVVNVAIPPGVPAGTYTWLSGLTAAGTLHLVTEIAERPFTIAP